MAIFSHIYWAPMGKDSIGSWQVLAPGSYSNGGMKVANLNSDRNKLKVLKIIWTPWESSKAPKLLMLKILCLSAQDCLRTLSFGSNQKSRERRESGGEGNRVATKRKGKS